MPDAGQASGFLDKVGIPRALTQHHCLCSAREDRQKRGFNRRKRGRVFEENQETDKRTRSVDKGLPINKCAYKKSAPQVCLQLL